MLSILQVLNLAESNKLDKLKFSSDDDAISHKATNINLMIVLGEYSG